MLSDTDTYQILRDGSTATYDNFLIIDATPDELVGTYACSVLNSAGQSNVESVNIQGKLFNCYSEDLDNMHVSLNHKVDSIYFNIIIIGAHINGNEGPLTVGTNLQLNCSSDLAILMAEWLYNDIVIAQNVGSEASLVIPSVNDSMHNRQYNCRITTPFGVQERNTTLIITGKGNRF